MGNQFKLFFLLLTIVYSTPSQAQNNEDEIKNVIHQLFNSMEKGDSSKLHSAFAEYVTMATISKDKDNSPKINYESSINDFIKTVGTPHPEIWYEEIWDLKIKIDGDFGQAWCDYAFYVGNRFSHCGVDAFHLYRGNEGWRIFHLADTRRKENCNVPPEIQQKHK